MNKIYIINPDKQNQGIKKIRIKSKYITLPFNTLSPSVYTQTQLQRFYKYKELQEYITFVETEKEIDEYLLDEYINDNNNITVITDNIKPDEDYNNMTLKELRILFPDIKSTSKKDFIEKIYGQK